MHTAKKVLSVLLVCVMFLSSAPLAGFVGLELPTVDFGKIFDVKADAAEIVASGSCGENVTYTLDGDGVLTISGTGAMHNYSASGQPWNSNRESIKEVVIENGVTSIGSRAFGWCYSLRSVTIPDSVVRIGDSSFYYCTSLTTATIPDSVTSIGDSAFYMCLDLTAVVIPQSVTSIGDSAFTHCSSLTKITVDDDNVNYSSDENGVFFNKDKTTLIQYPAGNKRASYAIPDSVTIIEARAFSGCEKLTFVTIGSSVTNIKDYAFSNCYSLTSIAIPAGVTSIGYGAFYICWSLTEIMVDDDNMNYSSDEYGVLLNKDKTTLIRYPEDNTRISYVIPDSVTNIMSLAFADCQRLSSVIIPDSVTNIGHKAFDGCSSLISINIPNSVTNIEHGAFDGCSSLISINIPDSITSIEEFTFSSCKNLSTVILGDNIASIKEYAFYSCSNLQTVGYTKDAAMKENITIAANNEALKNATWYYNMCKTEHQYSNACDANCDKCDFPRTVDGSHTYTNTCDESCDICGAIRYVYHTYADECDSICNICNYEREIIYDYTITTDEEITLTYSSDRDVEFVISDTSVAYVRSTGKSSIIVGSYVSIKTSATITPKKPGSVIISVVDSYNNILTKALLLVSEGEHQLILSEVVSEQSCVNPKEYIYKCKFCTYEEKVYEDPLGHTYTNTCDPICDRCFAERTDIKHTNTTNVEAVEATCSAVGYTAGVYCNDCEKYISGHEEIAAIGHDYNIVATAPTCTEKGVKIFTCITCGNLYAEDIDAIGHSEEIISAVAATCTQTGLTQGTKCTVCGEILVPQTEIPVLSHADENTDGYCDHCATLLIQLGDVDGDGQLTSSDARAALRAAVGLDALTEEQKTAADADGDNNITSADARLILRAAVGLEDPTLWAEKLYSNI